MTIEKAIEIISRKSSIPNEGEIFEDIEKAYDMAVEALLKQIPKKILNISNFYACPACGIVLSESAYYHSYCHRCGQALDWG